MVDHTNHGAAQKDRRFLIFNGVWPIACLVLMASTWRLWVGTDRFPQIPLLSLFVGSTRWIDYMALAICVVASLPIVGAPIGANAADKSSAIVTKHKMACWLWAGGLLVLFLTNQHRLQPWAWQFFIFAVIVAISPNKRAALTASRVVLISIYLWSSISKFDYQFLNGLGRQFAAAIPELFGATVATETITPSMVVLLPLAELLVGLLLVFQATRVPAVIAAVALHLGLVAILGPWGMDHHAGVVIWNVFFAIITTVLFWPTNDKSASTTGSAHRPVTLVPYTTTILFTVAVVALPVYPQWDHWLAWGLYSPNNRRCTLKLIKSLDDQSMAPFLQPFLVLNTDDFHEFPAGLETVKVDLGRISLEMLDAPIYPESRMQLGVVQWLERRYDLSGHRLLTIESKSDRFSGQRVSQTIGPNEDLKPEPSFFFNHLPRYHLPR